MVVYRIYMSSVTKRERAKPNVFGQVSGNSRNYTKQICTCRKEHRNLRCGKSRRRAKLPSSSTESNKRRRKRSRRQRKKALKRESDRPRRDCFTTLCICVRGRSSDELRTCTCTREISSSQHECCCVKGQKVTNKLTPRSALKNDTQMDRYIADSSTGERKPALNPHELSLTKPNKKRSVIIRGLHTVRRGINRISVSAIKLFTGSKSEQ